MRLAQECDQKLSACPALTRKALAVQLDMTKARLNQILSLLRLAPEIQREILNLTAAPGKRVTELNLLALLRLNSPEAQIEGFHNLLVAR